MMKRIWKKPELMSPAGHWPQLKTAIEAGADAVYFGLKHFTARAKVGFGLAELPEVMQTLHARGAKGFVTFNTLVFDHELWKPKRRWQQLPRLGPMPSLCRTWHCAARQAHRTGAGGAWQHANVGDQCPGGRTRRQCGCARVVLGRELSLPDIERMARATDGRPGGFCPRSALRVSYSGQCFSSEAWGGRSANRGQCAQACRLAYDLIVDGRQRDLGAYRYLLSPGDLYALHQVPELVRIGVACFKIEGRYKDSEYVALTTQAYRKAIDEACAGLALSATPEEELALEQVYSRGLGPYFLTGTNHQQVVHGRAPRHRGVQVGEVVRVSPAGVQVKWTHTIKRGDGLVFDAAAWRSPEEPEEGGNVYEVQALSQDMVLLQFGRNTVDLARIRVGDLVWRSLDPALPRRLKRFTEATSPVYTRPVSFAVTAHLGAPLQLAAQTETGHSARATGTVRLAPAQRRALDEAFLREHLGKLGGTPFHVDTVTLESAGPSLSR